MIIPRLPTFNDDDPAYLCISKFLRCHSAAEGGEKPSLIFLRGLGFGSNGEELGNGESCFI